MNININRKKIYLSRHGESLYNLKNKIGGNSDLSEKGLNYAKSLSNYIKINIDEPYVLYCSTLLRTINTSKEISNNYESCKCLDEINAVQYVNIKLIKKYKNYIQMIMKKDKQIN